MKTLRLTQRFGVKLLAWFLLALSVLGLMGSGTGIFAGWELDAYSAASPEELRQMQFYDMCASAGHEIPSARNHHLDRPAFRYNPSHERENHAAPRRDNHKPVARHDSRREADTDHVAGKIPAHDKIAGVQRHVRRID